MSDDPTREDAIVRANTPDHYWYRQGKDDGVQSERDRIVEWLTVIASETPAWREALSWASVSIEAGEHLK